MHERPDIERIADLLEKALRQNKLWDAKPLTAHPLIDSVEVDPFAMTTNSPQVRSQNSAKDPILSVTPAPLIRGQS